MTVIILIKDNINNYCARPTLALAKETHSSTTPTIRHYNENNFLPLSSIGVPTSFVSEWGDSVGEAK